MKRCCTKRKGRRVRCGLCAHRCRIDPGARGVCGVRENREGILTSLVYGAVVAENVDPIEKKPLFHLLPGSRSFSIATAGCNFRCSFCQNHEISQMPREEGRIAGRRATPAEIVELALRSGSQSIAYTYTEPTVYFEFAYETAGIAREKGLKNVFVTNGYMTAEMLRAHRPAPRRGERRSEGLPRRFLPEAVRGAPAAGPRQPAEDEGARDLGRGDDPPHPGPQRRRRGASRSCRLHPLPRGGDPLAHQPLPPPVPDDGDSRRRRRLPSTGPRRSGDPPD